MVLKKCFMLKRCDFFFMVHDYCSSPQESRLVLHEGKDEAHSQNLTGLNIISRPLHGMECVEL